MATQFIGINMSVYGFSFTLCFQLAVWNAGLMKSGKDIEISNQYHVAVSICWCLLLRKLRLYLWPYLVKQKVGTLIFSLYKQRSNITKDQMKLLWFSVGEIDKRNKQAVKLLFFAFYGNIK